LTAQRHRTAREGGPLPRREKLILPQLIPKCQVRPANAQNPRWPNSQVMEVAQGGGWGKDIQEPNDLRKESLVRLDCHCSLPHPPLAPDTQDHPPFHSTPPLAEGRALGCSRGGRGRKPSLEGASNKLLGRRIGALCSNPGEQSKQPKPTLNSKPTRVTGEKEGRARGRSSQQAPCL
jgi:hypothetical protein